MKQKLIVFGLLCGLATFVSCGNSNPGTTPVTILPHRALISNLTGSRIDIADTSQDRLVTAISGDLPGRLLLSNDKKYTVSLSPVDNSVSLVINATQAAAAGTNLLGASEGLVMSADDTLILGAVPTEAGPVGQAPGAVDVVKGTFTTNGATTSVSLTRQPSIYLPGARFVAATPNTNRVFVMADAVPNPANSANPGAPAGRVWVIATSLVNGNTQPYTELVSTAWDHPVSAVLTSDNKTAYILNCGPECGGTQASIVKLDLTPNPPSSPVVVGQLPIPSGATVGFLNGNTLYVAGSDPSVVAACTLQPCGGTLTLVDLGTFSIASTVPIGDGNHDRIALGSNNLLFVGAIGCHFDPVAGYGCMSLYDTVKKTAKVLPPFIFTLPATGPGNDDVTGMTPIANRSEVYAIEAGELIIYDTTTGLAKVLNTPPNIIGQGVDVVAVDF